MKPKIATVLFFGCTSISSVTLSLFSYKLIIKLTALFPGGMHEFIYSESAKEVAVMIAFKRNFCQVPRQPLPSPPPPPTPQQNPDIITNLWSNYDIFSSFIHCTRRVQRGTNVTMRAR